MEIYCCIIDFGHFFSDELLRLMGGFFVFSAFVCKLKSRI